MRACTRPLQSVHAGAELVCRRRVVVTAVGRVTCCNSVCSVCKIKFYTIHQICTSVCDLYVAVTILSFRLIIMGMRFRASDLGQVAKTNLVRANRNRLLVRRWCSGHLFFYSCD